MRMSESKKWSPCNFLLHNLFPFLCTWTVNTLEVTHFPCHISMQCNSLTLTLRSHKTRLRFRCPSHSIIAFCIDAPLWQIEFECKSIFTISAFNLTTKQRFLVEFSVLQCCNVYGVLQLAFYWLFLCVCVFVHEWEIRNMQFHCRNGMKSIFSSSFVR